MSPFNAPHAAFAAITTARTANSTGWIFTNLYMYASWRTVLYTDGVTEAANNTNEFYGEERFEHFLSTKKEAPVKEIIGEIKKELDVFTEGAEQSDDITILALEYFGA
jgi:serine phosphatase RsbU (regulator of sigma subunit)